MSLNGLIVVNQGGTPIYINITNINLKVDPILVSSFLSAIQSFAQHLEKGKESYINEMSLHNFKFVYRQFDLLTFIGIIEHSADMKGADMIFEYLIWAFSSRFRPILQCRDNSEVSQFKLFDELFLQYNHCKEKELKKLLEKSSLSNNLLQGILNKLINYFPIKELVKMSPHKLIIIGKNLIVLSLDVTLEEEHDIINKLMEKTNLIYGPQLFESMIKELKTSPSIKITP